MNKRIIIAHVLCLVLILFAGTDLRANTTLDDFDPQYFSSVEPTGLPYSLIINSASIEGISLLSNDEIGVFDDGLCVGVGVVTGEWPLTMTAWEGDPENGIEGFTSGHTMSFRIWQATGSETYRATPSFSTGDGTFGYGFYSQLELEKTFHFSPVEPTGLPYAIIIDSARVGYAFIEDMDEIAVFDDDLCVGRAVVNGEWPLSITAWEGDPVLDLPGFTTSNTMVFKLWLNDSEEEVDALPVYTIGDGTFGYGVYSLLSLDGPRPPELFNLLAPEDDITLDTLCATFSWEATTDPDPGDQIMYALVISTDESFTNPVMYGAGVNTEYPVSGLADDTDFWWKVLAGDTNTDGTFSIETWTFHTAWPQIQSAFSLIEPLNGSVIGRDSNFEFTAAWEESIDPDPDDYIYYDFVASLTFPDDSDTTLRYSAENDENLTLCLTDSIGLENWESYFVVTWHVEGISNEDTIQSNEEWVLVYDSNTGVFDQYSGLPMDYEITSLYPNPFNPEITAVIGLPETSELRVNVYNVMGRHVAELTNRQYQAGYFSFTFDGSGLSSGVYLIRVFVPGKMNQVRKVILMK